jgi:hypothetical protein
MQSHQRTLEELEAEAFGEDYSPEEEAAAPARAVPVKPSGSITGKDDTLRDKLTGLINKPLSMIAPNERAAYDMAQRLMTLGEVNPLVGAATSAGDFYDAAKRGDKSDMASAALWTGLNAAGVGGTAKFLKGGLREQPLPWGEFDPFKPVVR